MKPNLWYSIFFLCVLITFGCESQDTSEEEVAGEMTAGTEVAGTEPDEGGEVAPEIRYEVHHLSEHGRIAEGSSWTERNVSLPARNQG